jgi:hypothetical protein
MKLKKLGSLEVSLKEILESFGIKKCNLVHASMQDNNTDDINSTIIIEFSEGRKERQKKIRLPSIDFRPKKKSPSATSSKEIKNKVKEVVSSHKMGRPKGSIQYTEAQVKFMIQMLKEGISDKQIIVRFNKTFGTKVKAGSRQIYNFMKRNDLLKYRVAPKYENGLPPSEALAGEDELNEESDDEIDEITGGDEDEDLG